MRYKSISLDYLKMMAGKDSAMEKTMLSMLINDLDTQIPKLSSAIQRTNWSSIQTISHHLKSSFAFVGNGTLSNSIKIIEQTSKSSQSLALVEQHMTNITQLLPHVKEELRDALAKQK